MLNITCYLNIPVCSKSLVKLNRRSNSCADKAPLGRRPQRQQQTSRFIDAYRDLEAITSKELITNQACDAMISSRAAPIRRDQSGYKSKLNCSPGCCFTLHEPMLVSCSTFNFMTLQLLLDMTLVFREKKFGYDFF